MKLSKRSLAMMVAIVLCAATAIGGTFAYLTDQTDSLENVMTVGNVDIEQDETFTQDSPLYPGKEVQKEVFVTNTGSSPAYVRTLISFEMGDMTQSEFEQYVKYAYNDTDWTKGTPYVENGLYVVPFTYNKELAAGDKTSASLTKVWLDKSAGNDEVEKLAGTDGKYSVFAMSQAVQTEGFTDAETALAAAFGGAGNTLTATDFNNLIEAGNAGVAGSGNVTIDLESGATYDMAGWTTPISVDGYHGAGVVTINGNGATMINMTAPLFAGGFAGTSGIVIKDLTIQDSQIVSSNTLGSGAFIESIDSMPTITLDNCHLKDSTVTGSRTGGLIGWNSGYNNVNDGPVQTYVTITDCSVDGCEITGNGTVGGIVGHAGANAWTWNNISGCTVSNTTLTSNDDSYRVGAIVGTANVGTVNITNCTSTGNTITQNNAGTEIARPAGQSELYGRFVPQNGEGKLTIDGVSIQ